MKEWECQKVLEKVLTKSPIYAIFINSKEALLLEN